MTRKLQRIAVLAIVSAFLLSACGGGATPTDESTVPPVVVDEIAVSAEGRLLPRRYVQLSFRTSGQVAEILVAEGETVEADQVIARLADEEQLAAQAASAEMELINARQALDDLNTGAAMARAQAELEVANAVQAVWDAERRLNSVSHPNLQDYQDALSEAQENVAVLEANQALNDIGALSAAIQSAQEAVDLARDRLGEVQAAEAGCGGCDPDRLRHAQDDYNGALNALTTAQLNYNNAAISITQQMRDARQALEDAQNNYNAALAGPNQRQVAIAQGELSVAKARLDDARRNFEKVKDGPDPDKLAAAEARVASAEASLAAAQDALARLELRAPFAGTIANLMLKVGEQVAAGAPAAVLADFSGWMVETDNLTEIDVVNVSIGQKASVVLDALPDKTLHGVVKAIEIMFEEKRGDITYTVTVDLTDADPLMRWGMTAVVTFEK